MKMNVFYPSYILQVYYLLKKEMMFTLKLLTLS